MGAVVSNSRIRKVFLVSKDSEFFEFDYNLPHGSKMPLYFQFRVPNNAHKSRFKYKYKLTVITTDNRKEPVFVYRERASKKEAKCS